MRKDTIGKPFITPTPVRSLEELAKPKVELATAGEMESLIRERQGYKAQEKVALNLIAKINPVIYSHMARMEDGVQILVADSRLPEGKVWKAVLGGATRTTVNLPALKMSMLAHGIQPAKIDTILNYEVQVVDEETGKLTLTQVVKTSTSDSVNIRMVNAG
jgi:hypothetical protein